MRYRHPFNRRQAASYKWSNQLTKHSDAAAKYAQKVLRKEPALTAHRPCEGEGCERVTVKADRRKASVKIGVDASDVEAMKHVCSVYVGGEKVKTAEYPLEMEEEDLGREAANLLLAELKLAEPSSPEEDFGAERVASFYARRR